MKNMKVTDVFVTLFSVIGQVVQHYADVAALCDTIVLELYKAVKALNSIRPKGLDWHNLQTVTLSVLYTYYKRLSYRTASNGGPVDYFNWDTGGVEKCSKDGSSAGVNVGCRNVRDYLRSISVWCEGETDTFIMLVEGYLAAHNRNERGVYNWLKQEYTQRHKSDPKPTTTPKQGAEIAYPSAIAKRMSRVTALLTKQNAGKVYKALDQLIASLESSHVAALPNPATVVKGKKSHITKVVKPLATNAV